MDRRVDRGLIGAAQQIARVLPGNAAGGLFAADGAQRRTVDDRRPAFIFSRDAADHLICHDQSVKAAILDASAVNAGNAADAVLGTARCDLSFHGQIFDLCPGFHDAEKPQIRCVSGQLQSVNAVVLPVKAPAEDRHGHFRTGRVDVLGQNDRKPFGIGIGSTALRKGLELTETSDLDAFFRRKSRRAQRQDQNRDQQRRYDPRKFFIRFHLRSPPPAPLLCFLPAAQRFPRSHLTSHRRRCSPA